MSSCWEDRPRTPSGHLCVFSRPTHADPRQPDSTVPDSAACTGCSELGGEVRLDCSRAQTNPSRTASPQPITRRFLWLLLGHPVSDDGRREATGKVNPRPW